MRNSLLNLDNHTQSPNPDSIGLFAKHFLTIPAHFFKYTKYWFAPVAFANLYFEIQKHA